MLVGQLAIIAAAVFTGAAIYINFVEQPARLGLDDQALLAEWKPAYKNGFAMQAPVALIGFLLGLLAWWQTANKLWLYGAVVLVTNWPYTLFFIRPTNNQLLIADCGRRANRALIEKWGRLHAVRSLLGVVATVIFLWASAR
jgi:hypothetical protein